MTIWKIEQIKRIILLFSAILFSLSAVPAFSTEDPMVMLQGVTDRVMSALRAHRAELYHQPKKLDVLVEDLILPHVDFGEMARWVVGRNAWKAADSSTQAAFVNEFKTLVVRSYAHSLLEYTNQKIEILPIRGSIEGKSRIRVLSVVHDGNASPIHIDYHLIREGNVWRVYDIIIEGVSLMQGYRAQFADDIRDGGIEKVIHKMHQHNQA